jgi:hypothetical protein
MRVTRDGVEPLAPRRIGGKVTKKKARMFNIDVLEELNFWRDFLFEGRPRLFVSFGNKGVLAIGANFLSADVSWPGVPAERAKSFKNAVVEEDLFDMAALEKFAEGEDEYDSGTEYEGDEFED